MHLVGRIQNVDLIFIKDSSEIFHRTKYIDEILSMTTTEFVGIWDSDVIIPIGQIFKSIECLVSHESDFAFPFDGRFFDTGDELRKLYLENYVIDILIGNQNKMKLPYGIGSVGGAFLGKTTNYLCAGGENQNFYGWGVEDGERARRWEILGYKVKRIPGPLFHLTHPRGINSTFINESQKVNALKELLRITNMDTAELQCEILKWNKNV